MIIRPSQQDVDNYFASMEMNQSSLKVIISEGIESYLKKAEVLAAQEEDFTESKGMLIGSAVDHYFSFGKESFYDKYYFSEIDKKPSEKPMIVIKSALAAIKKHKDYDPTNPVIEPEDWKMQLFNAANEAEYFMNRAKTVAEDTRYLSALKGENRAYWDDLARAGKRIILADDESTGTHGIINSFENHKNTAWIFKDSDDVILIYQFICYFVYDGVPCKAMIDLIRIDLKTKRIYVFDMKTGYSPVTKFNMTMRSLRYDLQGSFYMTAISFSMALMSSMSGIDLSSFTVQNLAFVYDSYVTPGVSMIFPCTNVLNRGAVGDNQYVKGWKHGITIYKAWHKKDFSVEKMFPKGVIMVDSNFDYQIEL